MKKPALGIIPQKMWIMGFGLGAVIPHSQIEARKDALVATIKRRVDNNDDLLIEWVKEYNNLVEYLKEDLIE